MILRLIFFFVLGISIGSFLNVLIYRLPKNESILGRSYCDNCKKKLLWYDLIPLFSFVNLGGKCRFCKKNVDWQVPLVEIITALFFVSVSLKFPILADYNLWFYLFFVSSLIAFFFVDSKYEVIPDKLLYPTVLISIVYIFFGNNPINHIISGLGAFFFFLFLYFVTKGKGMGGGDVKLSLLLGLILGFPKIVVSLYLAFLTGALISLILILWRKKRFKGDTIPFGPFLALSAIICLFLGDYLVSLLSSFW